MTVTRTLPCKVTGIATRLRMENDDEIYLKLLCMRVDRAVVFLENSSRKLFLITSVPYPSALPYLCENVVLPFRPEGQSLFLVLG